MGQKRKTESFQRELRTSEFKRKSERSSERNPERNSESEPKYDSKANFFENKIRGEKFNKEFRVFKVKNKLTKYFGLLYDELPHFSEVPHRSEVQSMMPRSWIVFAFRKHLTAEWLLWMCSNICRFAFGEWNLSDERKISKSLKCRSIRGRNKEKSSLSHRLRWFNAVKSFRELCPPFIPNNIDMGASIASQLGVFQLIVWASVSFNSKPCGQHLQNRLLLLYQRGSMLRRAPIEHPENTRWVAEKKAITELQLRRIANRAQQLYYNLPLSWMNGNSANRFKQIQGLAMVRPEARQSTRKVRQLEVF